MTCLTCHSATTHGTGARAGPMLRAGGVAGLCAACHDAGESNSAGMHARGLGRAHLASPNGVRMPLRAEPDDGTQSCVVCHDGTIAGDGSAGIGRDPLSRDSGEHPVGIPYRSSRTDDSAVRLVPLDRLNARVRLFDRQVGCGSCHSVYSGERALLVRSNLNSQLCASCHME
ncbi:MAG: cytochrome c3 family protein [Phycisphaerales bacterium]